MAGAADNEKRRFVDRIRAITFKECKDEGADFITKAWVAERLQRSTTFVQDNWNNNPYNCEMNKNNIGRGGYSLNEHEKRVIRISSGHVGNSCRKLAKKISSRRLGPDGDGPARMTVYRYLKSQQFKPFHVIKKPLKTEQNKEDRLWFCDFLSLWGQDDFLHLACSDEFFIWIQQKPNHQNDRIWALTVNDIEEHERYRLLAGHSRCIGLFICFTAKKMMWVIKDQGESWTGDYFRETIIRENLVPFLENEENVIDREQVTFLHDKAPCVKALATQQMLRDFNIDFFNNTQWPGNSPDLNPCENLGSIVKDRVESKMHNERDRFSMPTFSRVLNSVLENLRNENTLFEALLRSFPDRLAAVVAARGGHTKY